MVLWVRAVNALSPADRESVLNWRFAAQVGARLARPGPPISEYTRGRAVAELLNSADRAQLPVRETTGLTAGDVVTPVRVVDRPEWIRSAAASMAQMVAGYPEPQGVLARHVAGGQLGAVLAFVSSGILGQYEPFSASGQGTLLLVYPNIIDVERRLPVLPDDFRMWVCLHEVTHQLQFTAHPWLSGYLLDSLGALLAPPGSAPDNLGRLVAVLARSVRRADADADSSAEAGTPGLLGMIRALQPEPQRAAFDRLMVLGTLLEGHAEHVMDAVGPAVVPSVATIRAKFDERRQRRQSPLQRLIRTLLTIDAKLSQYTRGKAFVDEVVGRVGMQRFNTIWTDPQTLPLPAEIEEPQRWIDRVL